MHVQLFRSMHFGEMKETMVIFSHKKKASVLNRGKRKSFHGQVSASVIKSCQKTFAET